MHKIVIATDGSSLIKRASKNRPRFYESSSACCIYIDNENVCNLGVYHERGTISLGELYAIVLAFDRLNEILSDNPDLMNSNIFILSDSEYIVRSLNLYIRTWARQGINNIWKSSQGDSVSHQSLFKYIWNTYHDSMGYKILESRVYIYHMRGHINQKISSHLAKMKFRAVNAINAPKEVNAEMFEEVQSNWDFYINANHSADRLAEKIRLNKDIYYEDVGGDGKWHIKRKKTNTRNGKIVILPRSSRKS